MLSQQTDIPESEILRLAKLVDLSRIRWVNHTFAYVLLEASYDSTENVARADYEDLYEKVRKLNEEREYLPITRALDIGVTSWTSLGGGVLTGKYSKSAQEHVDAKRPLQARLQERNLKIAEEVQ